MTKHSNLHRESFLDVSLQNQYEKKQSILLLGLQTSRHKVRKNLSKQTLLKPHREKRPESLQMTDTNKAESLGKRTQVKKESFS